MKTTLGVILAVFAILSIGLPFVMQEPPSRAINALSPRSLALALSVAMLILLVIRAQTIWESKRVREVRDYGPNLLGYAIVALAIASLLVLSDIADLQDLLPKSPLGDFVLLIRFCTVSALATISIGLLAMLSLSDWLAEKGQVIQRPSEEADYTRDYDLTNLVLKKQRAMNQELHIPWEDQDREKQPRIVHHEWHPDEGMFKLEIAWMENVKLQRCEVVADAKGRITSINMLKPETV